MNSCKSQATWGLLVAFLLASEVQAATLNVPAEFPSIQAALTGANSGDIIKIAPGSYQENNLAMVSGVSLLGSGAHPEDTVIDGNQQGRILSLEFLEEGSSIANLCFINGLANGETSYDKSGGAIFVMCSPFIIENCVFRSNTAETFGGAIRIMGTMSGESQLRDCKFESNRAEGGGALDCSYDASPQILNNIFTNNTAQWGGALACRGNSNPEVVSCRFDENQTGKGLGQGGAVHAFFWGEPHFTLCTFTRNTADVGGAIYSGSDSPTDLTHCTITENTSVDGGAGLYTEDTSPAIIATIIAFQDGSGVAGQGTQTPNITCSDIFGNSDGNWIGGIADQAGVAGNLEADPLFCETDMEVNYLFNLHDDSPCAETAGACPTIGAWQVGCDAVVGIGDDQMDAPRVLSIHGATAWPNPFNPQMQVHFELESSQKVRVVVFSIAGRRVRELADTTFGSGQQNLTWDGRDQNGRALASGPYVVMVIGEQDSKRIKVTLLK